MLLLYYLFIFIYYLSIFKKKSLNANVLLRYITQNVMANQVLLI